MSAALIREARAQDVEEIVRLLVGGSLSPEAERPEELDRYAEALAELTEGPGAVLVAEVDGEVVGVGQLITFRHLQHAGGRCAEVESLHVDARLRSQGIGGALLDEMERRASELGCYRIQLTSNLRRPDAHRFYEAHGYAGSHRGFKKSLPG